MTRTERASWDQKHRGKAPGDPEPFVIEMMPMLPREGLALDVAAGRGRNSIALARNGMGVVAADFSFEAIRILNDVARKNRLPIWPVVADLDRPPLCRRPHRRSRPDVERLAPALHQMADDPAVTGHAPQGLNSDRTAVEKLRSTVAD